MLSQKPLQDSAPKIVLDGKEATLCRWLDETARSIGTRETCKEEHVEVRLAGGWVRDKILGQASYDLDVAIASMSGLDFAHHFRTYLVDHKDEYFETFQIEAGNVDIVEIASNPGQSKHLDTVKVTLGRERSTEKVPVTLRKKGLGPAVMELDFVNLRSEDYAENSRIPSKTAFGTPLQDAFRRDLTINALFYNVHNHIVEDHTGKGLEDLKQGQIRTPLPALETFKDDPLRLLRAVRFASRFNFTIVQDIWTSVADGQVFKQLESKVSKERIGIEVEKMFKGPRPRLALELLGKLGLWPTVFGHDRNAEKAEIVTRVAEEVEMLLRTSKTSTIGTDDRMCLWLASAMLPHHDVKNESGRKGESRAAGALRQNLKLANKHIQTIDHLHVALDLLSPSGPYAELLLAGSKRVMAAEDGEDLDRRTERRMLGRLIREKALLEQWPLAFLFARACWSGRGHDDWPGVLDNLEQRITTLGLEKAYSLRPLLDGKQLMKILVVKPGKVLALVLEEMIDWQLEHPRGNIDDCRAWLERERERLLARKEA